MNKTRQERMKIAKRKIASLEKTWKKINKQYDDAKTELAHAERSFDIGEVVLVKEYCKRGCCLETSYTGTIMSMTNNGAYNVQSKDHLYTYVSGYDMTRPEKDKA